MPTGDVDTGKAILRDAVRTVSGMDSERAAIERRELGLDGLAVRLPSDFDDPVFSRRVLGLPD